MVKNVRFVEVVLLGREQNVYIFLEQEYVNLDVSVSANNDDQNEGADCAHHCLNTIALLIQFHVKCLTELVKGDKLIQYLNPED